MSSDQLSAVFGRLQGIAAVLPMAKLRELMIFAMVLWFLAMLAELVWLAAPTPQVGAAPLGNIISGNYAGGSQNATASGQQGSSVDVTMMKSWNLFGSADAVVIEEEAPVPDASEFENATETRLQLTLLAVMASNEAQNGQAVIQASSRAELYKVGDEIQGQRNVKLEGVLIDRVILNNRGNTEYLLLYDENAKKIGTAHRSQPKPRAAQNSGVLDHRNNAEISRMAKDYRQQLLHNPMSLADAVKVSMAKDANGQMLGYRVRPGRLRQQFTDLGLKSGDVITSVNGISLGDPSKAVELYTLMRDATEASVVIKRGNQDINLLLNIQ